MQFPALLQPAFCSFGEFTGSESQFDLDSEPTSPLGRAGAETSGDLCGGLAGPNCTRHGTSHHRRAEAHRGQVMQEMKPTPSPVKMASTLDPARGAIHLA